VTPRTLALLCALLTSTTALATPALRTVPLPLQPWFGTWTQHNDIVTLQKNEGFRSNLLVVPSTTDHGNGVVAVDYTASIQDDFSLMARVQAPNDDVSREVYSAILLSVEPARRGRHRLAMYRVVDGQVREMSATFRTSLPTTAGETWTVQLTLDGHRVEGRAHCQNCRPTKADVVLTAHDDTLGGDGVGLRVAGGKTTGQTFRRLRRHQESSTTPFVKGSRFGPLRWVRLRGVSVERFDADEVDSVDDGKDVVVLRLPPARAHAVVQQFKRHVVDVVDTVGFNQLDRDASAALKRWQSGSTRRFDSYFSSAEIALRLHEVSKAMPDASHIVVGQSRGGVDIRALIVDENPDAIKPTVLLMGGVHGLELFSTDVVLDAIDLVVDDTDWARRVRQQFRIVAIPMLNPDGADAFLHASTYSGRKNGPHTQPGWTPSTGVDLNRNFPFGWGSLGEVGSRSLPSHFRFRGTAPGSEPEVQALLRFVDERPPMASLTVHTYATAILVPYTLPGLPVRKPSDDENWQLALRMKKAMGKQVNGRFFRVKRRLYPVDGTDQDHFFFHYGTSALLLEAPVHNPKPKKRQRARDDVKRGVRAFFDGLRHGPLLTLQVCDADDQPMSVPYAVDVLPRLHDEPWTTSAAGVVHRLLPPQTRRVRVTVTCPTTTSTKTAPVHAGKVQLKVVCKGG